MGAGDLLTVVVGLAVIAGGGIAMIRERRARKAAPPPVHRPRAAGGSEIDKEALITIGNVAADGARSSMG